MPPRIFSSDKNLHAFGEWITSNGGFIHESLVFTPPDSTHGSQILTTSPLPPNTRLLSCPHALAIDYPKAQSRFLSITPHAALCLFLCDQRLLGETSLWWPYIRILPREFNTPLYFTPEDLQWLQGCNLNADEVAARKAAWKSELEAAVKTLQTEGADTAAYTWDLYLWSATVFSSRSFPGKLTNWTTETSMASISSPDCHPALFPLIDSVNHQPLTKITWQPSPHALNVVSGAAIPTGAEVCNNYGPKPNEELLLGYGFTLPSNPFDTVPLRFSPPLSPTQLSIRKHQTPSNGIYHLTPNPPIYPPSLLELFHLLTATPSEHPLLTTSPRTPPTTRNTLATHSQLLLALRRKLSVFPPAPSLPEPTTPRRHSAKLYRTSQITILTTAISHSSQTIHRILSSPHTTTTLSSVLSDPVFGPAAEVCFGDVSECGMGDVVMALYVCWKYISGDSAWRGFFERVGGPGEKTGEEAREVYEGLFPGVAEAAPGVFAGEVWTVGVVGWGMGVFEREGVEVGGEWVLCVE